MATAMKQFEESINVSDASRIHYFMNWRDGNPFEKRFLLVLLHGMFDQTKRVFPQNKNPAFARRLPESWAVVQVNDPLLFYDKNHLTSMYMGEKDGRYVGMLCNHLVELKNKFSSLEEIFVCGFSVSGLIALKLASELKAINFNFSPILYAEGFHKHRILPFCDQYWDGDYESFKGFTFEVLKSATEFKHSYIVCNQHDYTHNLHQTFRYYASLVEVKPENEKFSERHIATPLIEKCTLHLGEFGAAAHFVPNVDQVERALKYFNSKEPDEFDIGKALLMETELDTTEKRAVNLVKITDAAWS